MNANRLSHASTKRLRQFVVTLIAGLLLFASVVPGNTATISIVDSLGVATPDTQFSTFAAGTSILPSQFVGPKFTLTQPTTLTEIGAFVNNCISIIGGVPQCPNTLPFTVQIRPATTLGVPNASVVLATFTLSHDNDPLTVSFESVSINLLLQPGSYFALFAPQGADQGFLLAQAFSGAGYQAGLIQMGALNPFTSNANVSSQFGAVRILGETNVLIDGCDSGVSNTVLPGGLTISDLVADCAEEATNHGQFVSCIAHVTNDLKKSGIITSQEKNALQGCAAQADIP